MTSFTRYFLVIGLFLVSFSRGIASPPGGKIHISYWEKWSGAEENAMQRVVDEFNHSQDRIVVDFLSVGEIEQKTLLAAAGGDPPDVSGVFLSDISSFADRDALTPLSGYMREDGSTPKQFLTRYAPAFAEMGSYEGDVWGVPSTPTTTALYWNKDLFRAAGLDPEKPPQTVTELAAMSDKLSIRNSSGELMQVGFLPQLSEGWIWSFPQWFGGEIFDGKNVTIGSNPANLKACEWIDGFSKRYGIESIRGLTSSFGPLSTPQDPFMSGQVAMIIDGVWRVSFIQQFAPGLNYGVAGWPEAQPGVRDFTIADADMLVIPRGAQHPREAWEFLKYVSSSNLSANSRQELSGVELLCYYQKKPSPLAQWSPYFTHHHPNPDIDVFRRLAESPHAIHLPKMGIWVQYNREIDTAIDEIRLGIAPPEEALQHCQARVQDSWKWHEESLARRQKQAVSSDQISSSSSP